MIPSCGIYNADLVTISLQKYGTKPSADSRLRVSKYGKFKCNWIKI